MNGRPWVVYVTYHLPWPVDSGGRLREAQLIQRLVDRFEIDLVAVTKDLDKDRRGLEQAGELGVRAQLFAATQVRESQVPMRYGTVPHQPAGTCGIDGCAGPTARQARMSSMSRATT